MGVTDKWALPYPEADTLISVSAPIVQELAEKIDAALSAVSASDSYIIPGTLIADFTTSGTFTPPAGVTLVHVAVIGGGGNGEASPAYGQQNQYFGSARGGGGVRVYRDVPVSGDVAVTVGGPETESTFGALTAPGGHRGKQINYGYGVGGRSVNQTPAGFPGEGGAKIIDTPITDANLQAVREANRLGTHGPTINGTHYAGGGGAVLRDSPSYIWPNATPPPEVVGGDGGGGRGDFIRNRSTWYNAANGTNGTGGGGGGRFQTGPAATLGGSGRVMIWSEQTTRDTPLAAVDPVIMAALNGPVMVGAYAVDPVAPVDTLGALVPFPDEPQPTGEEWTDEETGETGPVLAWPEAGWTYIDGEWSPPDD